MEFPFMAELPGVAGGTPLLVDVAAAVAAAGLGGLLVATAPAVAVAVAGHGRHAGGQAQEAEEGQE